MPPYRRQRRAADSLSALFAQAKLLGAKCDECPLNGRSPPVFGVGPEEFALAVVGEAPGKDEIREHVPFYGRSGELLDSWLADAGLSRTSIRIDNAMLCMPPGGDFGKFERVAKHDCKAAGVAYKSPILYCNERLLRALHVPICTKCGKRQVGMDRCACGSNDASRWAKVLGGGNRTYPPPKVIVPMGNAALLALLGLKGITKWRGSPLEVL